MLKEKGLRVLRFDADVALGRVIDELRRALGPPPSRPFAAPDRVRGKGHPLPPGERAGVSEETAPPTRGWVTHGREEVLVRWCELEGIPAKTLHLMGYEEELE